MTWKASELSASVLFSRYIRKRLETILGNTESTDERLKLLLACREAEIDNKQKK